MNKETGGSAFPVTSHPNGGPVDNGMTLRDYFAAKAMQSVIVTQLEGCGEINHDKVKEFFEVCSEYAYVAADAMIEARYK